MDQPKSKQSAAVATRSDAIDILRAFGVLGTIFQHTYFSRTNATVWFVQLGKHRVFPFIFANGWLGVSMFFLLSGFVLYRPTIATDSASIWRFYKHRAWRLWPLLIFFTFTTNLMISGSARNAMGYSIFYCTG